MPLTTTDSLNGKTPKRPRCEGCGERSPVLYGTEMGKQLCVKCAPAKNIIGGPVKE